MLEKTRKKYRNIFVKSNLIKKIRK